MATSTGAVRTKRRAAPRREPADEAASKRLRKQVGEVAKDLQAAAGARQATPQKLKRLRESLSELPLKSVLIGATAIVMVAGVGVLLGRWWTRR